MKHDCIVGLRAAAGIIEATLKVTSTVKCSAARKKINKIVEPEFRLLIWLFNGLADDLENE